MDVPEARALLESLRKECDGTDDYQYVLAFEGQQVVFRVVSTLGDYIQEGDSGLWVPHRALLTHFGRLGLFTADEIAELEDLLNNPNARETEFQRYFETHTHFFRRWDYRGVHPHVFLQREDEGPLVPDFILTNRESQEVAILELKRANLGHGLVRRQRNRTRFTDAILEARAQLLEYRDWFEIPQNRQSIRATLQMEVLRPRLMVVIGRSSDFADEVERQKLRSRAPDIEVVTYDDILRYASDRRVFVEGMSRGE